MRFGFIGSRPLHPVPLFILFPLDALLFYFFFFHVFPCFMSCHRISFLLLRTHGSALSMYMRNLLSTQALGRPAQVLTMRWVVIGCSCALGSFSLQPHTPLSRRVSSSCLHSFVFLRTHSHFCPDLSASRLPSGRRVCVTLGITGILRIVFEGLSSCRGATS